MEEHVRAYARLRLEMAREELETARDNIASGHHRAALFSQSVARGKHSGVESAFSEYLVKPGHVVIEVAYTILSEHL